MGFQPILLRPQQGPLRRWRTGIIRHANPSGGLGLKRVKHRAELSRTTGRDSSPAARFAHGRAMRFIRVAAIPKMPPISSAEMTRQQYHPTADPIVPSSIGCQRKLKKTSAPRHVCFEKKPFSVFSVACSFKRCRLIKIRAILR